MCRDQYLVVPRIEGKLGPTLPQTSDNRLDWIKHSNLDIIEVSDDLRPVVIVDLLDLEPFPFVRAELVVQDRIHVNNDIMVLGSFGQFEEFFLGSILRTNPTLLVKLAEVIDVVNVIADTLQSTPG